MPYMIISCSTTSEYFTSNGPTTVGDASSDSNLMQYLRAAPSPYGTYDCAQGPRWVLDKLEARGYRVVAMSSITKTNGNRITSFWTLYASPPMQHSNSQQRPG